MQGLKRLLVTTAVIALMIAIPRMLFQRIMTVPGFEPHILPIAILIIAITILISPLVVWGLIRGPRVFSELQDALRKMRQLRQRENPLRLER